MVFEKVVPATRWGGVPKGGVVLQKVVPEWGGVPKVGVVFQKVVPEWGGVPKVGVVFQKVVPEWGGVPKVGVVFQKVVPESPPIDGVVFQKLGWCSKKLSQNSHSVYYSLHSSTG